MLKRLLLTSVLGIFCTALLAQQPYSEYEMYMYSGRYSNPALSGIKEYGSSLTYQSSFLSTDPVYSYRFPAWSHTAEFGQSLFSGRGGVELRWNRADYYRDFHQQSGTLGYSHGFQIGSTMILRAGIKGRLNAHVLNSSDGWQIGTQGATIYSGNDLQFNWDAGISLHRKRFYAALGFAELTPRYIQEFPGIRFYTPRNMLSAEAGGVIPLDEEKEGLWKWSFQPYAKYYYNFGGMRLIMGSFVNFGPVQAGVLLASGHGVLPSVGFTSPYFRLNYSYVNRTLAFNSFTYFRNDSYHELALRFILPGKDKEANFMNSVYRGF